MTNTLIDNSDNLKLVDTIKEVLKSPDINQIDIATGYWDIPGTSILADELDTFLEKDGTKLRILIGRDPYLFAKYNRNPKYKEFQKWPEEFIRTDINDIEVINSVGYGCCPADAQQEVKAVANYVATAKGGEGIIREIVNIILR